MKGHRVDTVRARILLGVLLGFACGPATSPPSGESGGAASSSTSTGVVSGAMTTTGVSSTATTVSLDSGTTGMGSTSEGSADSMPKLDVWIPDAGSMAGAYEPCVEQTCEPGLECAVLSVRMDLVYSSCTTPCEDPRADCPSTMWPDVVCHPLAPEQSVCALGCEEGRCPPGMNCLDWLGAPVPICASF